MNYANLVWFEMEFLKFVQYCTLKVRIIFFFFFFFFFFVSADSEEPSRTARNSLTICYSVC